MVWFTAASQCAFVCICLMCICVFVYLYICVFVYLNICVLKFSSYLVKAGLFDTPLRQANMQNNCTLTCYLGFICALYSSIHENRIFLSNLNQS